MDGNGDYIVYVDESGDHGLVTPDLGYPVFVLAFCIVRKAEYYSRIMPAIAELKFKHFGHDMVILHEHEIRKARGPFSRLTDRSRRDSFMADLTQVISEAPFNIVAVCVQKQKLNEQYVQPAHPYNLAMQFGVERLHALLVANGQTGKKTHVVFESRGRREDDALELEFRRVCDGANYNAQQLPFEFVLADKRTNSCGLQLADLIARPIGLRILRPHQPNRAFDIIEPKFRRRANGSYEGVGLKVFPG